MKACVVKRWEEERKEGLVSQREGQKVTGPTIIGFRSKRKRRGACLQFPCVGLYFFSLSFCVWCVHCIAQVCVGVIILTCQFNVTSQFPAIEKKQHMHFLFLFLFYPPPLGQPPFLMLLFFSSKTLHKPNTKIPA